MLTTCDACISYSLLVSKSDNVNEEAVPLETFNVTNNTYIRFRMIQSGITGEYKVSIDQVGIDVSCFFNLKNPKVQITNW